MLLFYHFPKKIKFSLKKKLLKPYIKNKKLASFIRSNNFTFLGIRKESIFKFFSFKYLLYKNDSGIYLDISKSQKYNYFSFFDKRINMFFSNNVKIQKINNDNFLIDNYNSFDTIKVIESKEIDRDIISKKYYEKIDTMSVANLFFSYTIIVIYIIQLIYILFKWL